ncbi:MAG: site-2 protease family protein [Candidatus Omnitrophica bacterium]|nr:site-2 protease family protein [Candidatus Omnitrophota bacterium]
MNIFFLIILLIASITLHEFFHGLLAYKLGDYTPKVSGRLTLNPFKHLDLFGTVILPVWLFLISRGTFSFGYAKPVPINMYHFRHPKRDLLLVALAGPLSNIIIASALLGLLKTGVTVISEALLGGVIINSMLAIFNLFPIPPLDGSKILAVFLSPQLSYKYLRMQTIGLAVIFILICCNFFNYFTQALTGTIFSFLGIRSVL